MQGQNSLIVTVKSSKEQLKEILRGITAVKEFHFMGDCEEEHCVKAEIKTDPSSDIRELLFYQLAEKNLPILAMQLVRLSLEDIFLELTADDQAAKKCDYRYTIFPYRKMRTIPIPTRQNRIQRKETTKMLCICKREIRSFFIL